MLHLAQTFKFIFQESRVEIANNVLSSMDNLQINVVETPAGPTFFKVCNKTYVTDANRVKAKVELRLLKLTIKLI
jgi:hypothetical protein